MAISPTDAHAGGVAAGSVIREHRYSFLLVRHRPSESEPSVEKFSLTALARQQLTAAKTASSGRSSSTVYGGHEHVLRQTVIALAAGQRLEEHESPGEATVHVLHGRVRLDAGDNSWNGSPGDLLVLPRSRHSLEALDDATVLLTVAKV